MLAPRQKEALPRPGEFLQVEADGQDHDEIGGDNHEIDATQRDEAAGRGRDRFHEDGNILKGGANCQARPGIDTGSRLVLSLGSRNELESPKEGARRS